MLQNADGPWGDDEFCKDEVGNLTWKVRDNGTGTEDELTYSQKKFPTDARC
jgi:hypothetical protein